MSTARSWVRRAAGGAVRGPREDRSRLAARTAVGWDGDRTRGPAASVRACPAPPLITSAAHRSTSPSPIHTGGGPPPKKKLIR